MNITGKGMKFRWLNNAGFEMELSSGKHLLVDPWLDEAQIYPISIDEIERADYVLLTHTHDDHSDSIGRIQKRFPQAAIFVGDLSAEALCKEYDLNVERLFRIRVQADLREKMFDHSRRDRKSTRLNSSHRSQSRMPSSA